MSNTVSNEIPRPTNNPTTITHLLPTIRRVMVGLMVLALLCGMFLPIYGDEIGWRLQERAWIDGVDKLYADTCGANTLAVPPFFMLPVRFYSALFNGLFPDPFYVRLSGVAYALLWLALVLRLIGRLGLNRVDRDGLIIIATGMLGLGEMPLLMVWSRPEQPIFLVAVSALLVALAGQEDQKPSTARSLARALALVAGAVIATSYHVKGLMLVPLLIACLVCGVRGPRAWVIRIVASTIILGMAVLAARYWVNRLQCPGDPVAAALNAKDNLGLDYIHYHSFIKFIFKAMINTLPGNYIYLIGPMPHPMSQWLPEHRVDLSGAMIWWMGLNIAWFGFMLLTITALALVARNAWRRRAFDWPIALALVLAGSTLTWAATLSIRNVYEATFILSLLTLASVLTFGAAAKRGLLPRVRDWLVGALVIAMPTSLFAVGTTYGPALIAASHQVGFIAWQRNSVGVFGFAHARANITAVAKRCGIGAHGRPANLLLDEATYFPMMQSARPQFRLGVLPEPRDDGPFFLDSITDPAAYLRSRRSDGIVISCRWLPASLRVRAQRVGDYCCVPPSQL